MLIRVGALVALSLSVSARSQTPSCPPETDWAGLVRCALDRSPEVVRARLEVEAARGRLRSAGIFLPSNPTLEIAGAARTPPGSPSEFDRSLTLSQSFEVGGQLGARVQEREAAVGAAEAARVGAEREVTVRVLRSALEVWRLRQVAALAKDAAALAERLEAIAHAREARGEGAGLDTDLASATRAQAVEELLDAQQDLRRSEGALAIELGASTRLEAKAPLPDLPQVAASEPELERHGWSHRAELEIAKRQAEAARARVRLLERERIPEVTLSATLGHEEGARILGGALSVPLPLFRRNQGALDAERVRVREAEVQRSQSELGVTQEIRAAYAAHEAATSAARDLSPQLPGRLADDERVLEEAFRRGALPLTSLLASLRELLAARRAILNLQVRQVVASLELARAAGFDPLSPDLGASR